MDMDFEVIICGAGPIGLYIGYELHRRGVKVAVFERQRAQYPLPRAVMLDHESRRVFYSAGLGPELDLILQDIDEGRPSEDFFAWRDAAGKVITKMSDSKSSQSGFQLASGFSQPALEGVLLKAAIRVGCPIFRCFELLELDNITEGVKATFGTDAQKSPTPNGLMSTNESKTLETFTARYMIGCDGANSTVRRLAGIPFNDLGFEYDWLVLDLLLKGDRRPPIIEDYFCAQICDPQRPTTIALSGHGRHRMEFMRLEGETMSELTSKSGELLKLWGWTDEYMEVERVAPYTFRARWVPTPVKEHVILAGDAAHQLPPFIGQGFNSGVRDAASIVWRLEQILRGVSTDSLLSSYAAERSSHVKQVIDLSIHLGMAICETDVNKAEAIHAMLRRNGPSRPPPLPRIGDPSTGCYQDHPAAGYLSLQRKVRTKEGSEKFFDSAVGDGWCLIGFQKVPDLSDDNKAFYDGTMRGRIATITTDSDVSGDYAAYFKELDANVLLVRPDFYVFGVADSGDALVELARSKAFLSRPE